MRSLVLILVSIALLTPGIPGAGTLVGDWYQEDTTGDTRRAFAQPLSQSSEAIDVTLGLERSGPVGPVDLYLIVSSDASHAGCRYEVREITIDSSAFPVSGPAHPSMISPIKTPGDEAQTRLWREFRKGRNLLLRLGQLCDGQNAARRETDSFEFSLRGSSAAYRFVTEPNPVASRQAEDIDAGRAAGAGESGRAETSTEIGFIRSVGLPLLAALILVVVIGRFFIVLTRSSTTGPGDGGSARLDPQIGDFAETWGTTGNEITGAIVSPEDDEPPRTDEGPDIDNLPCYKVEHVIDGDTVIVSSSRGKLRIRLDSVDCPEGDQQWGDTAAAALARLIGGKPVNVEVHRNDDFGRTLATLYVREGHAARWVNVNETMVNLGHAWVMRHYYLHLPEYRRTRLDRLESRAKSDKLGLWNLPDPIPPWNWRRESQQPDRI